jgi:penicillin G amidase
MKILKKIFLILISIVSILAIAFFVYSQYQKPTYEGELQLKNISKTTNVYFDDFGIPHIYAENQHDAMVALGYVHAQDRLWQMELLRRIASGQLSEIFGTRALKNDKFFTGLGIDEASKKAVAEMDKNSETYKMSMAYLDGLNQYLENGKTPIEFTILGIEKQKFTLKDVYNTFGFMAFSFAMAQKTDPLLTDIRNQFGYNYLKDLGVNYEYNPTRLKITKEQSQQYIEISKSITELMEKLPVAPFIGSNSWVIGGNKTKSGKVLFANDPHIEFSQPGTWFEAHISCPNYEIYGFYVAGTPFPLLGHNRNYAYGMTMFENDDTDFFQEETNPNNSNQYKTSTGFLDYKTRTKFIKVKDSTTVIIDIKDTQHGPIINDLIVDFKTKKPVSLSWIFTQQPIKILDAVYGLSHAENILDFEKSVSTIVAPGLNIMYGDAKNNVAWFTTGKLYKLEKGVNSNFILNGSNGIDDRRTFFEASENPKSINPKNGYVYSANNMPEAINGYDYPGYYLPEDRAKRISGLLDTKSNWDKTSASQMITDNVSSVATEISKNFISYLNKKSISANENQAIKILESWKGSNNLDDVAPTIYNKWIYFYLKNTFEDELGKISFNQLLLTHIVKQIISNQSKIENSPWWDNVSTKNKIENRQEIFNVSLKQAISSLEKQLGNDVNSWTWNRVHKLEVKHPLGSVAVLKPLFNVGVFDIAGSNEVINNNLFTYNDNEINTVKGGPSTRRIIDFSNIENSLNVLPTGNSGNPFSKHYDDQAEMFVAGKFRKMELNKNEIIKTSTKLVLKPKK